MTPQSRRACGIRSDRWLLSYADFVTLLFAVFAVVFLLERSGKFTSRQVLEAVVHPHIAAVTQPPAPVQPAAAPKAAPQAPPQPPPAAVGPERSELADAFREDIAAGKVEVRSEPRGLVISLGQAAFFPSGRAEVNPSVYPIIGRLAEVIGRSRNPIRLEGHTDSLPIRNSRFRSNWELSAARSIAILELLVTRYGVARNRLSVAGFADTEPIGSNDGPRGRARNRRVDVILLEQPPATNPDPAPESNEPDLP